MLDMEHAISKNVKKEYYEAVASQIDPHPFPSPVNDPKWLKPTVEWFTKGENVLEVGPGRGEFAEAAIERGGPKRYYFVDMSKGMLDIVKNKTNRFGESIERVFINADIDYDPLQEITDGSLDRIIMINAFQDVDPDVALETFRRIVAKSGLLRINVISREIREEYLSDDENYDKDKGYFYLTRSPSKDVQPLGFLKRKDKETVPYYRVLRSYYRTDMERLFNDHGFKIVSVKPIVLPWSIWSNTVAGRYSKNGEKVAKRFGGHPGSLDVISRPI